jgi:hypothetical protein
MGKTNLDVLEAEAKEVLLSLPERFTPSHVRQAMVEKFGQYDLKFDISAVISRLLKSGEILLDKEDLPESLYRRATRAD